MMAPLVTRNNFIGSINILSSSPTAFDERAQEMLGIIASHIAPIVERTRLLDEQAKLVARTSALADISREISSSTSPADAATAITPLLRQIVQLDGWTLRGIDENSNSIVTIAMDDELDLLSSDERSGERSGLTGKISEHIFRTREGVIASGSQMAAVNTRFDDYVMPSVGSFIGVPLVNGAHCVGTLFVFSAEAVEYSDSDLEVVNLVANQIAGAIEITELIEQQIAIAQKTAALAAIGKAITSSSSPTRGANSITRHLRKLLKFDGWNLRAIESADNTVMTMAVDDPMNLLGSEFLLGVKSPLEGSFCEYLHEQKKGILAGRDQINDVLTQYPREKLPPVGSFMVVPLVNGPRCIGALYVFSKDAIEYTQSDLDTFQLVADQIAGAIENGQLLERSAELSEKLNALAEMSKLFSGSESPDALAVEITPLLKKMVALDGWAIRLLDESDRTAYTYIRDGHPKALPPISAPGVKIRINENILGTLINARRPMTGSYEEFGSKQVKYPDGGYSPISTFAAVPLVSGDRCFGALFVDSFEQRIYSSDELESLQTVADHIAGAIENSELLRQTTEDAEERAVLVEIAEILSRHSELEKIPTEFAEQLLKALPAAASSVWIINYDSGEGRVISRPGVSPAPFEAGARVNATRAQVETFNDLPTTTILDMQKLADGEMLPKAPPEMKARARELVEGGVAEVLAISLRSHDRFNGLIRISGDHVGTFNQRHVEFGNQVSVLVSNALESQSLRGNLENLVSSRTTELRQVVDDLEAFTYSVSHDLRAPLRASEGFANLLMEDYGDALPEGAERYVGLISKASANMGVLIDDLLDFSKLSRREITRRKIDVAGVVADAMRLLEGDYHDRVNTQVHVEAMPDAYADPTLLRQVYTNLIGNALKFSAPSPEPQIRVYSVQEDGRTVYCVSDNGVGFEMKYADRIFGVFERLHTIDEFDGTGVGLAIVERIIERHGGTVQCEAEPGNGAKFSFTLSDK